MSTDIIIGSGVRVEVGLTEGAEIPVTGISKSDPGLATVPAHGLAFGSAGYFKDVVGMDELEGQAARVTDLGSPSAGAFGLEDIDTTDFGDFVSANFVPVTSWATLTQSTTHAIGGGAAKTEDIGTLIDRKERLRTIKNAAETVTIDIRALKDDNAAMAKIRKVARAIGHLVFRVTYPPSDGETVGSQRLYRGQPSLPGESVQQGASATGQLTVTIDGQICFLQAI
jgi:hypothetical protein